jgi:hypothetical protein
LLQKGDRFSDPLGYLIVLEPELNLLKD